MTDGEKICTKCGISKPHEDFYLRNDVGRGNERHAHCKQCHIEISRLTNKARHRALRQLQISFPVLYERLYKNELKKLQGDESL